ncbi:MAG: hypothetical protein K8R35_10830 [Bacteroidales bacterium]|nr:hypothetical protein [Bacteroidales bacterium]
MKSIILLFTLTVTVSINMLAQTFFEPNYMLKTPETVNIIYFELNSDATIINLNIENRIEGGYFCIDPNTYIITDSGDKIKLSESIGLPLCPDSYQFRSVGEIKYVTLKFPAIIKKVTWIDLIEECGENCLEIYGITLDQNLNSRIDYCFSEIENGNSDNAIEGFESILLDQKEKNHAILGSVYINLIELYREYGMNEKANLLINELERSLLPHKELLLKNLRVR